jgi:hypothetical protein
VTPQQRSVRHLVDQGYSVVVVEYHDRVLQRSHDLLGFIDLLAFRGFQTLAVQTTSAGNTAARERKIRDSEFFPLIVAAGWRVICHGWRDAPDRRGNWLKQIVMAEGRPSWEQLELNLEGVARG